MMPPGTDNKLLRIGLIEDDESFQSAFQSMLQASSLNARLRIWSSAELFWHARRQQNLDVLFIDVMLGSLNGVELAGAIHQKFPHIRKVMLTNICTDAVIYQALRNGCLGYILKSELSELENTIQLLMDGGAIITPTIAVRVLQTFHRQSAEAEPALVSAREKQVLDQLVCGHSTTQIADLLDISVYTVRNHIKKIYQKLHASNRQIMMRRAAELGFF